MTRLLELLILAEVAALVALILANIALALVA